MRGLGWVDTRRRELLVLLTEPRLSLQSLTVKIRAVPESSTTVQLVNRLSQPSATVVPTLMESTPPLTGQRIYRSPRLALVLAFVLGPFGLAYTTLVGSLLLIPVSMGLMYFGIGLLPRLLGLILPCAVAYVCLRFVPVRISIPAWQPWLKVGISLALTLLAVSFIGNPSTFQGESMSPAIRDGQILFFAKFSSIQASLGQQVYQRNDLVLLTAPNKKTRLVKRLIGLPGDVIQIKAGRLTVNGVAATPETEAYWKARGCLDTTSILANQLETTPELLPQQYGSGQAQSSLTVPLGHVFVIGDNRTAVGSEDSRLFGPVPLNNLKARIPKRKPTLAHFLAPRCDWNRPPTPEAKTLEQLRPFLQRFEPLLLQ